MSPAADSLHRTRNTPARDFQVVAALLAGATLVAHLLDQYVSLTSQAMLYVLAVVVASYALSRTASIVCAVGAVTLLNFFFVPPRFTFQVDSHENLAALLALLTVALVISHLGIALRRETEWARLNARRARQLQALATDLAHCTGTPQVQMQARGALRLAFPGPCQVALRTDDGALDLSDAALAPCRDGLLACMREAATLGPGTGRWPGLGSWFLPLQSQGHIGGAACIAGVSAADHAGLEHAQAICALVGDTLWRLQLAASAQAAQAQSRWHQAQNTFLAAISHDFRTPLASIMGAASSLHTQRDKLPLTEQARLTATVLRESQYLASLTENTLQLVRLENASEIQLDWQSVEEIAGAVLARVRARDVERRIRSRVPADLPLIRADPVLLAQLLENLLDNALKYSADTIELVVDPPGTHLEIAVHDRGDGIPAGQRLSLFEPYRRGDHAGPRGAGLGLAVCRAIARAHRGELVLEERPGGGSSFVLKLPLELNQPSAEQA